MTVQPGLQRALLEYRLCRDWRDWRPNWIPFSIDVMTIYITKLIDKYMLITIIKQSVHKYRMAINVKHLVKGVK